jgi:hypothetical protein
VQPFSYSVPAGSFLALAVIAGSISKTIMDQTSAALQSAGAAFASNNATAIASVTGDAVFGNIFQSGLLGYFSAYTGVGYVVGVKQAGYHNLAAGVGSFGYELHVSSVFGIPRSVSAGGAVMNIPIVNIVGSDSTAATAKTDFTFQLGALSSALEHGVPEGMFANATKHQEAISAVKALSKAAAAGQQIYLITSANAATVLPLIHHDAATMAEIGNAIAAGKNVITHTDSVSVLGWSGAGYVIYDPDVGSGAWKIAGGQNGAFLALLVGFGLAIFFAFLLIAEAPILGALVLLLDLLGVKLWVDGVRNANDLEDIQKAQTGAIVVMAFDALLLLPFVVATGPILAAVLFGMAFSNLIIYAFG